MRRATVDPRWFRNASLPARQLLAMRRHADLVAAAAAHYAAYSTGDSALLLFDAGDTLAVSERSWAQLVPTNIAKPALSSTTILRAEAGHRLRVERTIAHANALLQIESSPAAREKRRRYEQTHPRRRRRKAAA